MIAAWLLALAFAPGSPAPGTRAPEPAPVPEPVDDSARVIGDGPVAVTAKVTPDPSYIGDVIELSVVAAFPKSVSVNLPIGLSFEPLHLIGVEEGPPEATGEGLRKTFTIKLQYFSTGAGKIPGFPVTWVDASGEVHTLEVPPRTFHVESLLANVAEPARRDEDPPIDIQYPNTTAETVIYAAFGTLVFAFLAWLLGRRFFGRSKPVFVAPPIPAHEVALSALDELQQGDLVAGGQLSEYYLQLTEIAKAYVQGRFGVDALDRTTEEIRRALTRNARQIAPLSADEVIKFLQQCDLVKFARWSPPPQEAEAALAEVRQMVRASLPGLAQADANGDVNANVNAGPDNDDQDAADEPNDSNDIKERS